MTSNHTDSTETIDNFHSGQDKELLRIIRRNIETLKREKALGTRIDARSIEDLEAEYRKLAAKLRQNRSVSMSKS